MRRISGGSFLDFAVPGESIMKIISLVALMVVVSVIQAAPPEILSVRQSPPGAKQQARVSLTRPSAELKGEVARYAKLELRVDLKATFQNPYDPDDLDLWAEFTAPSGKVWKVWGFYNPSSWSALWMVRFAPDELGSWRYVIKVRDREGTAESKAGKFSVVAGSSHGFVNIAKNQRYLKYSDGS